MNDLKYIFTSTVLLLFFALPCGVKAQYIPQKKVITAHKTVKLTLPNAKKLSIIYRPGSNISDTVQVTITNNTYNWTPQEAGIVALKTSNGDKQTISVRFASTPFWGLFIMFGAAFVLFGGAIFGAIKLF